MKSVLAILIGILIPLNIGLSDQKYLEIKVIDGNISLCADAVSLGWLFSLLDRTAGTVSELPVELSNRNVSAQFSGLPLNQALKKIFEGLELDYAVLGGNQVFVTGISKSSLMQGGSETGGAQMQTEMFVSPNGEPSQPTIWTSSQMSEASSNIGIEEDRNSIDSDGEPAMIQTPFGPMVNPRAKQVQDQQKGFSIVPGGAGNSSAGPLPNIFGNTSPAILNLNKKRSNSPQPKL